MMIRGLVDRRTIGHLISTMIASAESLGAPSIAKPFSQIATLLAAVTSTSATH